MTTTLLLAAAVILLCLALARATNRFGVPALAVFIALGMLFGTDGVFRVDFHNYAFAGQVCTVALVFITFYGGFGTNWRRARGTAVPAALLSTVGVALTALLTGVFCRFALRLSWLEGLLVGAVISSTDAASVFSILRSKRLNLRHGTASLLEVESGSNDPCAWMLTTVLLGMMRGDVGAPEMFRTMAAQILFGAAAGVMVAIAARWLMRQARFDTAGYDAVLVFAVALLSYAGAAAVGGNGYLSAYVTGVILGNSGVPGKRALVHFFDGLTGLIQMLIFFLLGLIARPSMLPGVAFRGLLVALFLTLVARPAAVFALLAPFQCPVRQSLLVSWAGLRGASSIVFAIVATVDPAQLRSDIFHIVFFIVLFSIAMQGTLLPLIARKLGMIDDSADVMKTFSDYAEETPVQFLKLTIGEHHPWANRNLMAIDMIPGARVALVLRGDEQLVPRGQTMILPGDRVVLSGPSMDMGELPLLTEIRVDEGHPWAGRRLGDIRMPPQRLIVMIQRDGDAMIPDGETVVRAGDVLVMNQNKK